MVWLSRTQKKNKTQSLFTLEVNNGKRRFVTKMQEFVQRTELTDIWQVLV